MDHAKATELLQRQIENSKALESLKRFAPEWEKWRRDTEVVIQRILAPADAMKVISLVSAILRPLW